MSRFLKILKGETELTIPDNPPDIIPVNSIPCEVMRVGQEFTDVVADGEMELTDLLKVCGYKAGYVMYGFPVPHKGKFIYEVRRGIPRLD